MATRIKGGIDMEEKRTFSPGQRIDQMCKVCGEERGHVVASVSKQGKITRVSCPICGSRVPYTEGTTRRKSTKAGAPYDRAHTYRRGDTMVHPMFGEGEVTAVIEPRKIRSEERRVGQGPTSPSR